jgi:hypothetical protein
MEGNPDYRREAKSAEKRLLLRTGNPESPASFSYLSRPAAESGANGPIPGFGTLIAL